MDDEKIKKADDRQNKEGDSDTSDDQGIRNEGVAERTGNAAEMSIAPWTPEEIRTLVEAWLTHTDWTAIAESLPARTAAEIQTKIGEHAHTMCEKEPRALKKLRQTEHEKDLFVQGLQIYGRPNWSDIGRYIKTKDRYQVKNHSINYFKRLERLKAGSGGDDHLKGSGDKVGSSGSSHPKDGSGGDDHLKGSYDKVGSSRSSHAKDGSGGNDLCKGSGDKVGPSGSSHPKDGSGGDDHLKGSDDKDSSSRSSHAKDGSGGDDHCKGSGDKVGPSGSSHPKDGSGGDDHLKGSDDKVGSSSSSHAKDGLGGNVEHEKPQESHDGKPQESHDE